MKTSIQNRYGKRRFNDILIENCIFGLFVYAARQYRSGLRSRCRRYGDDRLDCFGIHGVGSGLGVLLLSFFIRDSWMAAANESVAGWTCWDQLLVRLKGMGATIALAAIGILAICVLIEKRVGLRIDEQSELEGMDKSLHRENGYGLIFPESR